jgi:O-antigen/teichoic acid export membrane protein
VRTEREDDRALDETLAAPEIRERAARGAMLLAGRGVLIRGLGFVGNVVLARLLLPSDFGLIAFGLTLWTVGSFLQDGGLGAYLIRRPEGPTRRDLQSLVGFQLAVTLVLCLVVGGLAPTLAGEAGAVTAVMVASLPLQAPRTANVIVLERRLSYGRVAVVELFEVLVYNGMAIGLVAGGLGVWGVAIAFVLRALAGTVLMAAVGPVGWVVPRMELARVRSWLGFGTRYQSVAVVQLLREQGLNMATVAVAGLGTLGIFALSMRLLQVITLLFESLWRVSYPAMAQLLRAGEEARPAVSRIATLTAVGAGLAVVAICGTAPALIPSVFGDDWRPVVDVLPWAGAGLMIAGPVSVACAGYLFAADAAGDVLRATILNALSALAVALTLLPLLDETALGVALLVASVLEAIVLARATARRTGWRPVRELLPANVIAFAAGACAWAIASSGDATLGLAALSFAGGGALFCAATAVLQRDTAARLVEMLRGAVARGRA